MKERFVDKHISTPGEVPAAEKVVTGADLERAIDAVENLSSDAMSEHVEAFEHAHHVLQEHLHGAVDG